MAHSRLSADIAGLVKRLRETPLPSLNRISRDRKEAADEIERLCALVKAQGEEVRLTREADEAKDAEIARLRDLPQQSAANVDEIASVVLRLRNFAVWNNRHSHYDPVPLCKEAADLIERITAAPQTLTEPNGLENLKAILADQPYRNSALIVHEIEVILANEGGFMPDEAIIWFREHRASSLPRPEQ